MAFYEYQTIFLLREIVCAEKINFDKLPVSLYTYLFIFYNDAYQLTDPSNDRFIIKVDTTKEIIRNSQNE